MILNIVAFKNEKISAFTQPQYIDIEPEKAAIQLVRSIKLDVSKATPYQNLTMWFLGTFDDETGMIEQFEEVRMLVDLRKVCKDAAKLVQEGEKDELLCTSKDTQESA